MTEMSLPVVAGKIIAEGPTRVIINEGGTAVPSEVAARNYQVKPDVIFIREDGWSFGAPNHLAEIASALWKGDWVGFMQHDGSGVSNPIWRWWAWEESPWYKGVRTTSEPPTAPSPCPECDKLMMVQDKSHAIGEFLEWLQAEKGVQLAYYSEDKETRDELFPLHQSTEELLAEFFDIDLKKVEEERRAMLERMGGK